MREAFLENKLKNFLKTQKIYFVKIHGGQMQKSGIPDLIINYNGSFIGCECKIWPNKLSELQKFNKMKIEESNGIFVVVDQNNIDEFISLLKGGEKIERINGFSKRSIERYF